MMEIDPAYVCCADEAVEDGQTLIWMGHQIMFKLAPGALRLFPAEDHYLLRAAGEEDI